MKVSIIIPTKNRAKDLDDNLMRISRFLPNYIGVEIIIIDNGSTDDTSKIVKKYINSELKCSVKHIYDAEPGLLTGRHRGYQESTGDILAFIDDDIVISEDWLGTLCELDKNYLDFEFFTGPTLPLYAGYPPKWLESFWQTNDLGKTCGWLSLMDMGSENKEIPLVYVWGLNFIVRRDAFISSGGFNPDSVPTQYQHFQGDGESGLSHKAALMGFRALYLPSLLVYHQIGNDRLTESYFGKRAYFQGVCDSYSSLRKTHTPDFSPVPKVTEVLTEQPFELNWKGRVASHLPLVNLIYSKLKRGFRKKTTTVIQRIPILRDSVSAKIHEHTKEQYEQGFNFHQKAFETDAKVREWVLRENYWQYKLPINDD
jgi:glycosyltransferase involved in cell wall biosynthesis